MMSCFYNAHEDSDQPSLAETARMITGIERTGTQEKIKNVGE